MANTRIAVNSVVVNVTGDDANIARGTISATGNIIGGGILTAGVMSSTGNGTHGNVIATANVQAGNIRTTGQISATGTIRGGNLAVGSGFVSAGNIISAGPITAALGMSATGNIQGGNILTAGAVTATGNIRGNFFIGNGSQLTGITASLSGSMAGNISANGFQILGLPNLTTSGNLVAAGNITAIGNVSGTYFIGNGSLLTGIAGGAGNYSNANVAAYLPTYTGNVGAGNVNVTGAISATGNVRGSNLLTQGQVSAVGQIITPVTVSAGNVTTNGVIIATGNISTTNGFFIGNGSRLTGMDGPAFIANQTVYQPIPYAPTPGVLPLIYNNVTKSTGGGYVVGNSTTGSIFTAPVSGYYQVNASIGVNPFNGLGYVGGGAIVLCRNAPSIAALIANPIAYTIAAGTFVQLLIVNSNYTTSQSSASVIVYLNAGDFIQAVLSGITTAPTGVWTTQTNLVPNSFQACWLRS